MNLRGLINLARAQARIDNPERALCFRSRERALPVFIALISLSFFIIILTACQPFPLSKLLLPSPTSTILLAEPTSSSSCVLASPSPLLPSTPIPIFTPTPEPTIQSTATASPTPLTCLQEGGKIEVSKLHTELLRQPLEYRIYLPHCYEKLGEQRYPVLYLIHGQSFNDDQWSRLGAPEIVDRLVAEGKMAPFIMVMPRDQIWLEPADDPFGQALVQDLIPYVEETYRTLSGRQFRAIGGLSRGGAWALHLGLTHWEIFSAVGMHSGFVFQSDNSSIKNWLNAIPLDEYPRIYMDISDNDRPEISNSAAWFESQLTMRGIPHEWHLFPGYHEEAYWAEHVEQYLLWYAQAWR